jgi:hypothetical protein
MVQPEKAQKIKSEDYGQKPQFDPLFHTIESASKRRFGDRSLELKSPSAGLDFSDCDIGFGDDAQHAFGVNFAIGKQLFHLTEG